MLWERAGLLTWTHWPFPNTDTLLDLHAKLSTVVRYYDRMLEERLSKAYNQHSLGGYNMSAPHQSSMAYPSLGATAPGSVGLAESFYTGEAPQIGYGQTPQPAYAAYDRRGSYAAAPPAASPYAPQPDQMPHRSDSWRGSVAAAPGQAPLAYAQQPPQQQPLQPQPTGYPGSEPTASQPSAPQETGVTSPSADPNAAFYFNNGPSAPSQVPSQPQPQPQPEPQQSPASAPSEPANSSFPAMRQPSVYQPSQPQQTPVAAPSQPVLPTAPSVQQQQQPSAPYWSHPAAQHQQVPTQYTTGLPQPQHQYQTPPQAWPQVPNNYNAFQQESFPSAPHHAIQQPVVEESLIDL